MSVCYECMESTSGHCWRHPWNFTATTTFTPPPVPYCTRCGIADSRVTHICPPLAVQFVV